MSDEEGLAEARKRARLKLDFYIHLTTYLIVIGALLLTNLLTSPEYTWVKWPAMGWGIALLLHGLNAFRLSPSKDDMLDTLARRELDKQHNEHHRS